MIYHHRSVLLNESITALNIDPNGIYIDGTFGLGGHSKFILSKLNKYGRLIAVDRDWSSIEVGQHLMKKDHRFNIIHAPFSEIFQHIQKMNLIGSVNGILLDLGVCESQIADATRGFSFIKNGFLDMRMDNRTGQTAAKWLASASLKEIIWVLQTFGEEKFAKKIAKSILIKRLYKPIVYSMELSKIISNTILKNSNRYNYRNKHPATRSFLAIRMYINKELQEITKILQDSLMLLASQGRLVVISFNSLEDRLVKNFISQYSQRTSILPKLAWTESQILNFYSSNNICKLKNMLKLKPTAQEIQKNHRARSAILRCAEKLSTIHNND